MQEPETPTTEAPADAPVLSREERIDLHRQRWATAFYDQLKNGSHPVFLGWGKDEAPLAAVGGVPRGVTGYAYLADNAAQLMMTASAQGFTSPYWMTFEQAKAAHATVRKGEIGTKVIAFTQNKETEKFEPFPLTVFNTDQFVNFRPPIDPILTPEERFAARPALEKALDARLKAANVQVSTAKGSVQPHVDEGGAVVLAARSDYVKNAPNGALDFYKDAFGAVIADRFRPEGSDPDAVAQAMLRREWARLLVASRLGLPRTPAPDPSWTRPFVQGRPNWREVANAIEDAEALVTDLGIERPVYAAVPRREVQPDVPPRRALARPRSQERERPMPAAELDDIPF
jgi:hypothetical protein